MTTILCYSRNRSTSVEQLDDETLVSTCTLQDTLTEAYVRIHIRFPELKILQAEGKFIRSGRDECIRTAEALEKIKGVRIGAGMKKIIRGLTGEVTTCEELPLLIEEACHGVILAFTKDASGSGSQRGHAINRIFQKNGAGKYPALQSLCGVCASEPLGGGA